MKRHATPRLRAYVTSGLVGLVGALALGTPQPALVAAALLVLVVVGLESVPTPTLRVAVEHAPDSIVEGEERTLVLRVEADEPIRDVHLNLALEPGLSIVGVDPGSMMDRETLRIDFGPSTAIEVTVKAEGWGRRGIGPFVARRRSAFGILELRQRFSERVRMISIPSDIIITKPLEPRQTNIDAGDLVSKGRGIGLEFAEMRPYQHGDDPRSLNWRVSSRLGSWWVNDRHPEKSGDVVILVDAQTQPGSIFKPLQDRAVRLAGALLREYGRRRYRIGLVTVDGVVRFSLPGSGEDHRRRLVAQLLAVGEGSSNSHAIERAVFRVAKSTSTVIAITPMLDGSLAGLAHSLHVAGLDVAVVEIDPSSYLPEPANHARGLGRRLWKMERERLRHLLLADGIPVAPWQSEDPPDVPLSQLILWRTGWRLPV